MNKKYLDMIRRIEDPVGTQREWSVYIVRCRDGTFYTGIAKDLNARIASHNAGKGASYTRTRRPVRLLYQESSFTRSEALLREARIKTFTRPEKERLVTGHPQKRLIKTAKK